MRHRAAPLMTALCALLFASPTAIAQDEGAAEGEAVEAYDIDAAFNRAARLASRGAYDQSKDLFVEIVQHDPTYGAAYFNAGQLAKFAQDWSECVLYYTRYLELEPGASDAQEVQGEIEACSSNIPNAGELEIPEPSPRTAQISIDGVVVANGSLGPLPLAPGTYEISAKRQDYHPYTAQVEIRPGERTVHSVRMREMTFYSDLTVQVDQEGAEVFLDGSLVGTTPLAEPLELVVGRRYLLVVRKPGFYDWQRYYELERDRDRTAEIEMLSESVDLEQLLGGY